MSDRQLRVALTSLDNASKVIASTVDGMRATTLDSQEHIREILRHGADKNTRLLETQIATAINHIQRQIDAAEEDLADNVGQEFHQLKHTLPTPSHSSTNPPREAVTVVNEPATTYAPPDHPGVPVPERLRPWSVRWAGYRPVDITTPQLRPAGIAASVAQGWAEPYVTPNDVPDWPRRQAAALVPFQFDEGGNPLNPTGRTGRTGRNLGKWGENQAADSLVIAGGGHNRSVLLIQRDDVHKWAIPGGMVDPGEAAPATLVRELHEEAGVDLHAAIYATLGRGYVADWRNTDYAWVCSTLAVFELPAEVRARAGSDALRAQWWPLRNIEDLAETLEPFGGLYLPHRPMLVRGLDYVGAH